VLHFFSALQAVSGQHLKVSIVDLQGAGPQGLLHWHTHLLIVMGQVVTEERHSLSSELKAATSSRAASESE
jgi:hypothetical protein